MLPLEKLKSALADRYTIERELGAGDPRFARALDAHRGEGRRVVITDGAGHREWMLRELRKRSDAVLVDVDAFIRR
jgi:hypothetical protein